MAKYLASEYCAEVVEDSFRIHGGYGYSKEYEIERLYREAPFLLIGEGTAEIQQMIIGRRLLEDYKISTVMGGPSARAVRPATIRPRALQRHGHAAERLSGPRRLTLDYPMSLGTLREVRRGAEGRRLPLRPRVPCRELLIVGHRPQAARAGHRRGSPAAGSRGGALSGMWLGLFVGLIFSLFDANRGALAASS